MSFAKHKQINNYLNSWKSKIPQFELIFSIRGLVHTSLWHLIEFSRFSNHTTRIMISIQITHPYYLNERWQEGWERFYFKLNASPDHLTKCIMLIKLSWRYLMDYNIWHALICWFLRSKLYPNSWACKGKGIRIELHIDESWRSHLVIV